MCCVTHIGPCFHGFPPAVVLNSSGRAIQRPRHGAISGPAAHHGCVAGALWSSRLAAVSLGHRQQALRGFPAAPGATTSLCPQAGSGNLCQWALERVKVLGALNFDVRSYAAVTQQVSPSHQLVLHAPVMSSDAKLHDWVAH